jgi:hypothetical protein
MSTLAPVLLGARFERQIVKTFRTRGAVSGPSAQRLRDLGLKDTHLLRHLITATIVRKAGPERFFLHEATWAARDDMSWRTVGYLGLAAGLGLAGLVTYLLVR